MELNTQLIRVAAAVLAGAIVSGCSVIGGERIEGWPQLEVVEHYVSHKEMRDRCGKYTGPFTSPEACAEFDFANLRCDVWYSADFPPPAFIVTHERQHCLGYDHVGETELREILAQHLEGQRALDAQKALAAKKTLAASRSEPLNTP